MNENKDKNAVAPGASSKSAEIKVLTPSKPTKEEKAKEFAKTLKVIDELHKKIRHRDKLENYTQQLDVFEIKKVEEDLEPISYYQGCTLTLKDDGNNKFEVRHPGIIKEVVSFLKGRFSVKLAEIESQIKLPA